MIEAFIKYLQFEKRLSAHTVIAYRNDLSQFSSYLLTAYETSPENATYPMIRSWVVALVEEGLDGRSVNRKIACLRSFYKFLLREELIQKDPMTKIKVLKTQKKLPTFVRESEMKQVLESTSTEQKDIDEQGSEFCSIRDQAIIELFYGTGIRLSELIELREKNIDWRACTIKVLGKRNKERVIPFPAPLAQLLKDYRAIRDREIEKKSEGYFFFD